MSAKEPSDPFFLIWLGGGATREIYWLNEKLIDFSTFRQKSENSDNAKSYPHKAIKAPFQNRGILAQKCSLIPRRMT